MYSKHSEIRFPKNYWILFLGKITTYRVLVILADSSFTSKVFTNPSQSKYNPAFFISNLSSRKNVVVVYGTVL